jgi:hypothetical protein
VVPAQRIRLLHNFRLPLSAGGGKGALLRFIGLLGDRYNESKSELKRESERNDRISKNNDFLFNELSNYKEAKEKTQDDLFRKFALILTEKREASNFISSSMPRLQETPKRRGGMLIGEMPESDEAPPPKRRGGGIVIGGTTVQVLSGSDEVDMHLSQQAPPVPAPKPAPSPSVSQAEIVVGEGRRRGFFAR